MADQKSKTILEKLTSRLDEEIAEEFDPACQFNNKEEFTQYITEGTLLNVSRIGAKALSIPCGEYVVWANDAGHTMLVPLNTTKLDQEVYSEMGHYDVLTPNLLNNWDKVNRTLAEHGANFGGEEMDFSTANENIQRALEYGILEDEEAEATGPPGEERDEEGLFQSRINDATVDRTALARAFKASGLTLQQLADKVGVHKSALSRWMRTGDGGRNPTATHLGAIKRVLGIDAETVLPDILGDTRKSTEKSEKRKKTRGSGQTNRAKGDTRRASGGWTKGNA